MSIIPWFLFPLTSDMEFANGYSTNKFDEWKVEIDNANNNIRINSYFILVFIILVFIKKFLFYFLLFLIRELINF